MKQRLILLIILLIPISGIYAQDVGKPQGDTAKSGKKTIKVNVIDPNGKKRVPYTGNPIQTDSVQKAIKIDPFLFLHGEYTLFFEWRLKKHFSIMGGVGLTYIDYTYEIFRNSGVYLLSGVEKENAVFHGGTAFRGQFRYFPSQFDNAINGLYIAPSIAYRTWRMDYLVSDGLVNIPYDVNREWTDIRIEIGQQDVEPYSQFFLDGYFNAGVRFFSEDRVNGQGVTSEIRHHKGARPVIEFGVRFGFAL